MSDLIKSPRHLPSDLGRPLPESPHAVSVCLPTWQHNIGYEEADLAVTGKMQCGYPRFFLGPQVERLFRACEARFAKPGERCFAFPSRRVAERCAQFVHRQTGANPRIDDFGAADVFAVTAPEDAREAVRAFWQHAGEIVSSRRAEFALGESPAPSDARVEKERLKDRVATLAGTQRPENVYVFPSGMAAIACAFRAFQRLQPHRRSVQFGFPYVDSLKIQQRFSLWSGAANSQSEACLHFPRGDEAEVGELARKVAVEPILGLFCEFPGNPLLQCPDLARLDELSRTHEFPLLVDDTLGALVNVDVLPLADAVTTSLTKFFSGQGDVIAGSLILNHNRPGFARLKAAIDAEYEDLLFSADALALEHNSRDCIGRVRQINATAERLCDALRAHPAVERVDYPKYRADANYESRRRSHSGYGGLFSFLLKDAARVTPAVYDALEVCKGPNLGTNFTLCCPYTILAHYRELDEVERLGVSRYLLRVSVGLEEADDLIARFTRAIDRATQG